MPKRTAAATGRLRWILALLEMADGLLCEVVGHKLDLSATIEVARIDHAQDIGTTGGIR